ncbi:hypothetical protein EPN29_03310 [bacterium]|nr:MAG: hypothetical protein EPN29_03310 [bacterium]
MTAAFGVLVSPADGQDLYTVSLVGVDGKVVASAQASSPATVSCGDAAAAVLPLPVSTSNSRAYFLDAQGAVRFLAPGGDTGRATTVPAGAARRSMFAVSPNDSRIAVVVNDYTSSGASTRLYVEDLRGGGHHVDIFSESGVYTLWPAGWHGTNNLVVAKVPACTQGGGPFCCGPQELHVIDPATAVRRFTLGSPTCKIAGPPSAAGAVCETDAQADVVNWTATTTRAFAIPGPAFAYISPNGDQVALVGGADTTIQESNRTLAGLQACGWIDDTHVFSGGDAQHQPRVGNVTTGGVVPVAAQGQCGGRLPGGL